MISTFPSRTIVKELAGWRAPSSGKARLRDCSLIIATEGRREEVERLLDALLAMPDAPAEVVVVDGEPAHELGGCLLTWRALHAAPFVLVYVETRAGGALQRNAGIDISGRDYLFFLDPGMLPLPGYFAEIRRVFEVDHGRCVAGVAGVAVNEMRGALRGKSMLRRMAGALPRVEPLIYHPSGAHMPASAFRPFSGLRRVDIVPMRACGWRREAFARRRFSRFFDECPEGADVDLSLRIGRSWTLLASGGARLRSIGEETRPEGYAHGRRQMRNRRFIWKRHTPRPAVRHVARFWMYSALMACRHISRFCVRPWRTASLWQGLGILVEMAAGTGERQPWVEPPASPEYMLQSERLRFATQGD